MKAMKKNNFLIILVLCLVLGACTDNSGEYERSFFTNQQLNAAIQSCLTVSLDTSIAHLAVPDGFSYYADGKYQMNPHEIAKEIVDTLMKYGYTELIDTLIYRIHRTAENNGMIFKNTFQGFVNVLSLEQPLALVQGKEHAITDYFKNNYELAIQQKLETDFPWTLDNANILAAWQAISDRYFQITNTQANIVITRTISQQMNAKIFEETAIEEEHIRQNSEHQVTDILKTVF
jgi:hypothetical protein